jgi:hypothetical protein
MISWDTMTRSSLSCTHHGHIHFTFRQSQNWTIRPLHLHLLWHPFLRIRPLPLSTVWWNPTTSPGKLFSMEHNSSRMRLRLRKNTCLSHIVKRGRTARLLSDFFGHCHSPDHSDTLHHHHQHQHQHRQHVASHKLLRTTLRNRGDVSCYHRSLLPSTLHTSTLRILLYFRHLFFFLFSSLFGYNDVSQITHDLFRASSMLLPIIVLIIT